MEKRLILTIGLLVVLAFAFLTASLVTVYVRPSTIYIQQEEEYEEKICHTPGCIHTASKLLQNMDDKVDPCDDFYDFACGSFVKNVRIPEDKFSVNIFSTAIDELQEQMRTLLDEPVAENELKPFVLAKTLYQACMNKTAIEADGIQPLLNMLHRLGGWPVLDGDTWDEEAFSWEESVYRFHSAGFSVDYFFDFSVTVDVKNSSRRVIDLDQAVLGLNRDYLNSGFDDTSVKAYYDYNVDIATILGADRLRAQLELKESLEFEMKLANISLPKEKRRNATLLYNPMTISELQKKFPSIPWLEYINRLLAPHTTVGLDELTIVNVPQYFTDLEVLLQKTPKRVQANYVMTAVARSSVLYLSESLRRREDEYSSVLSGTNKRQSPWQECVYITSESLPIAVGALYIRKYFHEDSKRNALEMVSDIRQQFRKTLTEVDWMDEETRGEALKKADAMAAHIAYPSEIIDNNKLTEYYAGLEMSPDHLFASILNLTKFDNDHALRKLRQPVNNTDWVTRGQPASVNAFYSASENSIEFPAGILQGAFFSADRPAYMNYGAIGFVIGHEITHGFDDVGRQFDLDGNLVDWWQESTRQKYLEKAKCIIDQYSNYTVKEVGLKLNGVTTQGENIADNGGIKEAYYAYQAWSQRHDEEPRLPGLEKYSARQMFWLTAAHTWCSVYRDETIKHLVTLETHAPGRFRVVGPMSNMEEFAMDFNCTVGSPMNPVHKCKIW